MLHFFPKNACNFIPGYVSRWGGDAANSGDSGDPYFGVSGSFVTAAFTIDGIK